ncbi:MAG TPA: hypothetical protein VJG32_04285 [Anaerolineae bacterium]|nr:hypothetical protein [Anaerolineae bacterium]
MMNQVIDVETADSNEKSLYRIGGRAAEPTARAKRRRTIRYFAAVASAATAVMYFLIGFHIVSVLDGRADQTWGIVAGSAYVLGALLLLAFDRRVLWIMGAILQVFVIYTYFNLASQRTPAYEVWGILIRIAQVMILIALVYLEVRLPLAQPAGPGGDRSQATGSRRKSLQEKS